MRIVIGLMGLLVLAFGVGCLNYTNAWGLEHHTGVARQRGWPEPSLQLFYAGVASTVLGSGAIGYALGKGRKGP